MARGALNGTPSSVTLLYQRATGIQGGSGGFRAAVDRLVARGEAVVVPAPHPDRKPTRANCARYALPQQAAEAGAAAQADPISAWRVARDEVRAAEALLADAKAKLEAAEAAAKDETWRLFLDGRAAQ